MEYIPDDHLQGQFLIAMPSLMDPNFAYTVSYMCVHNEDGAFGLVVNRLLPGVTGRALFEELGVECGPEADDIPVWMGGPVHPGHLFILHGPPLGWEASLPVSGSVAMTNSQDVLEAIAAGRGPKDYLLILGCAGWAPGQLEEEIRENSWLNGPADESILFHAPEMERWERAARSLGIDPGLLAETPGHA